jgi:hypothetical protein
MSLKKKISGSGEVKVDETEINLCCTTAHLVNTRDHWNSTTFRII